MLKLFRKSFGVNTAIGVLGIDINYLDPVLRHKAIQLTIENDYSKYEAAAFVYFQLPAALKPATGAEVINAWEQSGKIRKEVLSASRMGRIYGARDPYDTFANDKEDAYTRAIDYLKNAHGQCPVGFPEYLSPKQYDQMLCFEAGVCIASTQLGYSRDGDAADLAIRVFCTMHNMTEQAATAAYDRVYKLFDECPDLQPDIKIGGNSFFAYNKGEDAESRWDAANALSALVGKTDSSSL